MICIVVAVKRARIDNNDENDDKDGFLGPYVSSLQGEEGGVVQEGDLVEAQDQVLQCTALHCTALKCTACTALLFTRWLS